MTQPKVNDVNPAPSKPAAAGDVKYSALAETEITQALQHLWNEGMASSDLAPLDLDAIRAEGRRYLASNA